MIWNVFDNRKEDGVLKAYLDLSEQWREEEGVVQYLDYKWEKELKAYGGLHIVERKIIPFSMKVCMIALLSLVI